MEERKRERERGIDSERERGIEIEGRVHESQSYERNTMAADRKLLLNLTR